MNSTQQNAQYQIDDLTSRNLPYTRGNIRAILAFVAMCGMGYVVIWGMVG